MGADGVPSWIPRLPVTPALSPRSKDDFGVSEVRNVGKNHRERGAPCIRGLPRGRDKTNVVHESYSVHELEISNTSCGQQD